MKTCGKLDWALAGGKIPLMTNGEGPAQISYDKIAILNTSEEDAIIEITVFYEDEQPVGAYEIKVAAKRLRKIRFNDLIDPAAIRLERNYGCYIKASIPVVVQFSRMNTGRNENAEMGAMAFPIES